MKCVDKLPVISGPRCIICSKSVSSNEIYCRDCKSKRHHFQRGFCLWTYNKSTGKIVADIKYSGQKTGIEFITHELVYHTAGLMRSWNVDAIIPVPLHRRKLRKRGFNQAALIGEGLAIGAGVRYIDDVLYRVRYTRPQKNFDDKGRILNLKGAFYVDEYRLKQYHIDGSIVLVDDIYTSGSTIDACAQVLIKAGIDRVYCICLCIGDGY